MNNNNNTSINVIKLLTNVMAQHLLLIQQNIQKLKIIQ